MHIMATNLIIVLIFHFCIFNTVNSEKGKRLLLDDPHVLQSEVDSLQRQVRELKALVLTGTTGTTYTIWGRKDCPSHNGTETVYSGITGGSQFSQTGNGVNPLCLPHNPDLFTTSIRYQGSGYVARLYGSEYQFYYNKIEVDDVTPCAVCRVHMASSVLMIPAKNTCPVGWIKQYQGLMTANKYDHYKTEYLCLDNNPEYFEGTRQHDDNGYLFYPVASVCGSLPCPPYKDGAHLPCVVCTI